MIFLLWWFRSTVSHCNICWEKMLTILDTTLMPSHSLILARCEGSSKDALIQIKAFATVHKICESMVLCTKICFDAILAIVAFRRICFK